MAMVLLICLRPKVKLLGIQLVRQLNLNWFAADAFEASIHRPYVKALV